MDRLADLADLAVFARVAELRSFTAAAKALGLSKSAVSKQIARLEARLGTPLLQRTTRQLALTETGHAVQGHAARLVAEAEAAEEVAQDLIAAPRGLLRVTLPISFGLGHVVPLMPEFLRRYPDLRLDLIFDDKFVDLYSGNIDVALRIGNLPDSSLTARRLNVVRGITGASPEYLARRGRPEKPADLKQHECLIYTNMPDPEQWIFAERGKRFAVPVSGRLRSNNGEALLAAALEGHGIVRLPSFIAGQALKEGRLVPLLEEYALPEFGVHAVYPAQRNPTTKLRAFVDFMAQALGPETPWDMLRRQKEDAAAHLA